MFILTLPVNLSVPGTGVPEENPRVSVERRLTLHTRPLRESNLRPQKVKGSCPDDLAEMKSRAGKSGRKHYQGRREGGGGRWGNLPRAPNLKGAPDLGANVKLT